MATSERSHLHVEQPQHLGPIRPAESSRWFWLAETGNPQHKILKRK